MATAGSLEHNRRTYSLQQFAKYIRREGINTKRIQIKKTIWRKESNLIGPIKIKKRGGFTNAYQAATDIRSSTDEHKSKRLIEHPTYAKIHLDFTGYRWREVDSGILAASVSSSSWPTRNAATNLRTTAIRQGAGI